MRRRRIRPRVAKGTKPCLSASDGSKRMEAASSDAGAEGDSDYQFRPGMEISTEPNLIAGSRRWAGNAVPRNEPAITQTLNAERTTVRAP